MNNRRKILGFALFLLLFLVNTPKVQSEGSLFKAKGDNKIYEIRKGQKHWIPDPAVFEHYGFSWGQVKEVSREFLDRYPRGKLLKVPESDKIYYLTENGMIRHILNPDVFHSYGNETADVITVSPKELNSYPVNKLIKSPDGDIFFIERGRKHLVNVQQLERSGLVKSVVAPVNKTEAKNFPTSSSIPKEEILDSVYYKVMKVLDGDTVVIHTGQQVRLLGIDTPEIGEPCADKATKKLRDLTLYKEVNLESDTQDKDKYRRLLRFLYIGDRNVNKEIIKAGLARILFFDNRRFQDDFENIQKDLKVRGKGCLWN